MKRLFLSTSLTLFGWSLYAQEEVPLSLSREASIAAVRLIDEYESYSKVSKVTYELFIDLFSDPEQKIYNDLTGFSSKTKLPVREYAELLSTKAKSSKIVIKNVEKQRPYYRDEDVVIVPVSMTKEISYSDARGVYFSSKEIYGTDHQITMQIEYNVKDKEARICSLTGAMPSDVSFPYPYNVILRSGKMKTDSLTSYNTNEGKKRLVFNSKGQAFIPSGLPNSSWNSWDPSNVLIQQKNVGDGMIKLKAKHQNGRFAPFGTISLISPMKVSANASVESSSTTYEGGFDFGVIFTSCKQTHFGMFTGLGYSCTMLDFSTQRSDEQSFVANDLGTPVEHMYDVNLSQRLTTQWLFIPVFFRLEFISNKRVKPQIDFGVRFYGNPKIFFSNDVFYQGLGCINAQGKVNGKEFDKKIDFQSSDTQVVLADWYVSGFAGLGVDVTIYKKLSAFMNLSYELSFLSSLNDNEVMRSTTEWPSKDTLMYNWELQNFVAYDNIATKFTATKQALMLKAGISLKF